MMVPAMVAMPAAVPAMVTSPPHFGGVRLDVLLHRRRGAGVAERQSLRVLGRRGENEQSADRRKSQNFCHLHVWSPWVHVSRIDATQFTC